MPKSSTLTFDQMVEANLQDHSRRKTMDRASDEILETYGGEFFGQYVRTLIEKKVTSKVILLTLKGMGLSEEATPNTEDPIHRYRDDLRKWCAATARELVSAS